MRAQPQNPITFDPCSTDTPYKDRQQDPAQITRESHRTVLTRACELSNFVVLIAFLNGWCTINLLCEDDHTNTISTVGEAKTDKRRQDCARRALQNTQKFCSDMEPTVATGPDNHPAQKRQPTQLADQKCNANVAEARSALPIIQSARAPMINRALLCCST